MGKNKRRQLEFFDLFHNKQLLVDSNEEIDTLEWLIEARSNNIIIDFEYQPKAFILFDAVKFNTVENKSRTLFREHIYTADFMITFNAKDNISLAKEFKLSYDSLQKDSVNVYIDVKGTFNKTERAFGLNQKWLYQKYGIYVYKLIPKNFFKLFGCPTNCFVTNKKKQPRKMFQGYQTISEVFSH